MSMMGTAVSGMLANTNWLSTISQNVANANTTGYKNVETEFAALVDQVGTRQLAGGGVTATSRVAEFAAGLGGRHHRPPPTSPSRATAISSSPTPAATSISPATARSCPTPPAIWSTRPATT